MRKITDAQREELYRLQEEAHDLDQLVTDWVLREQGPATAEGPDWAHFRTLVDDAEAASDRWVAFARRITGA